MSEFSKSSRNKVVRGPKRGSYDQQTIFDILDNHFICHLAYVHDEVAITIPTGYGREGNSIYLHGALSNRMLGGLLRQDKVSLTVTHLDGLVLARSVFHHSFNYRSAVVFGKAKVIDHPDDKMHALKVITENIIPGRWEEARIPNEIELKRTLVVSVEIEEASAKIRAEGVNDEPEDHELDVWAGVLPLQLITRPPVAESDLNEGIKVSKSVLDYRLPPVNSVWN